MDGSVRNKMANPAPSYTFAAVSRVVPALLVALALTGCSSDVTRFDFPAFGLTEQNPKSARVAPALTPMQSQTVETYPEPAPVYQQGYAPPAAGYGAPNVIKKRPVYGQNPYSQNTGSDPYGQAGGTTYQPYSGPAYAQPGVSGPGAGTACGANPCEDARARARQPVGVLGYSNAATTTKMRTASLDKSLPPLPPGAPLLNQDEPPARLGSGTDEEFTDTTEAPAIDPAPMPAPSASYAPPAKPKALGKAGTTILVGDGDSLFRIAQDYGVSVSALMSANKLSSPAVKPGQKLFIPGNRGARAIRERKPRPTTLATSPVVVPVAAPLKASARKPAPVADAGPTYTVLGGESFNGVARKLNVAPGALASANGITDVTRIKQGQVLRVPAAAGTAADGGLADMVPPAAEPITAPAVQSVLSDEAPIMPAAKPAKAPVKIVSNGPVAASAEDEIAADGAPAMSQGSGKFRWPVRGRVIGKFNQKGATPNEGIDLAVPFGTEVHAAEDGTVAYSGDELPGYGKIVLIRHAGNWVTAYAHNSELLVKRGEAIRRGQVIAKAGKTGRVDQPLVHFELRKGSQPVDPLPYLAAN